MLAPCCGRVGQSLQSRMPQEADPEDASRGRSGPEHSGVQAFRGQGARALKNTPVRTFPQGQQVPRPPGRAGPPGGPPDQHVTLGRKTTCAALTTNLPQPSLHAYEDTDPDGEGRHHPGFPRLLRWAVTWRAICILIERGGDCGEGDREVGRRGARFPAPRGAY